MRTRRKAGFTLLELLVAMAIVGIVAGALFGSLRTAFNGKKRIDNALEPLQRAGITLDFLRRDLESALSPVGTLAYAFTGLQTQEGHDLTFCAAVEAPPAMTFQTDIHLVEYMVDNTNGEHALIRRVTSNLLSPNLEGGATVMYEDEVLCRGVLEFTLQYYDGTDWYDSWDSSDPATNGSQIGGTPTATATPTATTGTTNTLPLGVKVTMQFESTTPGQDPWSITRIILLPCAVPSTLPASGLPPGGF